MSVREVSVRYEFCLGPLSHALIVNSSTKVWNSFSSDPTNPSVRRPTEQPPEVDLGRTVSLDLMFHRRNRKKHHHRGRILNGFSLGSVNTTLAKLGAIVDFQGLLGISTFWSEFDGLYVGMPQLRFIALTSVCHSNILHPLPFFGIHFRNSGQYTAWWDSSTLIGGGGVRIQCEIGLKSRQTFAANTYEYCDVSCSRNRQVNGQKAEYLTDRPRLGVIPFLVLCLRKIPSCCGGSSISSLSHSPNTY